MPAAGDSMTDAVPLNTRVQQFVRTIYFRNIRETVAAIAIAVFYGSPLLSGAAWGEPPGMALPGVTPRIVSILGCLWIVACCWGWLSIPRRDVERFPPETEPQHWRRAMTVQARGLRLAWLWYVIPLSLGVLLVLLDTLTVRPESWVALGVVAVVFVGIAWLNVHAGRCIEAERDQWFPAEAAPPATSV